MISQIFVVRIGTNLRGVVGSETITRLKQPIGAIGQIGVHLFGLIRWGKPYILGSGNDISLAKEQEFIIVDASGIVGMNADMDKQRDSVAELGKDTEGVVVRSDQEEQ